MPDKMLNRSTHKALRQPATGCAPANQTECSLRNHNPRHLSNAQANNAPDNTFQSKRLRVQKPMQQKRQKLAAAEQMKSAQNDKIMRGSYGAQEIGILRTAQQRAQVNPALSDVAPALKRQDGSQIRSYSKPIPVAERTSLVSSLASAKPTKSDGQASAHRPSSSPTLNHTQVRDRSQEALPDTQSRQKTKPMRRRLIDSLSAAQESALNEVSPSDSEAHDANTSSDFKVRRRENVGSPQTDQNRIPKTSTASIESARETRTSAPPALLRSRITYARQRSFLGSALNDSVSGIHDAPVAALNNTEAGILSVAHKATTSLPLSADGDDPGRPVRSIHELRQAGDNARFQESVESLFDDIDNPGNSTSDICNGIIQLCKKLLEPNFMHRFSENAFDERLVKCTLGNLDVVPTCLTLCAYRLVCLKGIHSYSHLRTFWARLVDRSQSLLMVKDDIMSLAGKPRSHLSKAVQASLRDLIPQLTFLLFPDSTAPKLYPHLIILSCIQYCLAVFQDKSHRIESMSPPMLSSLVGLLLPNSAESPTHPPLHNNFQTKSMTLRILESYIMLSPMPRYLYSSPFQKFVLLHNDFIESAQDDQGRQILALYLRVILNLTNNECLACEQYASPEMIIGFARIVSAGLSSASAFFGSNEHDPVSLVILALGILTNLAEQSESCRACFLMPAHDSQPPLDILVQQFSLNIDLVSHAKSVSEVHSTVAVGYLSILLAVLCLHTEPCARIRELLLNFGREVASVKSTAKEFFLYYEKAERDSRLTEPQENGNTSTARLARIIEQIGQQ